MAKHKDMTVVLDVLKTLNHPVRLSILCNLMERHEMSAGEIFDQEKNYASQSQVSQYLKVLRDKGFVVSRRQGQYVHYKIASAEIEALIEKLHELFCNGESSCA